MTGLAPAAGEAYLAGWALTDAPWTGRVEAGCYAAVQTALEHRHDPGVLEVALQLGHLEGVWATVYARRERLQAKHERTIFAAWKACLASLDPADLARRYRLAAGQHGETADPDRQWWQDTGVAAAAAWLAGVYRADGYDALVAALADAIRAGMAEGEAGALALAASKLGRTGFRIGRAFKAAYKRLAADQSITRQAAQAATRLIDAAASAAGRRLAAIQGDGGSEQDMTAGVQDATGGKDAQAPKASADWTVWAAVLAGATAFYSRLASGTPDVGTGQVLLDWITAGDDRVCFQCQDYADNGPYAPEAVPGYPHPRCVIGSTRVAAPAFEPLPVALAEQARLAGRIALPGSVAGDDGGPLAATAAAEAVRNFGRARIRAATDREYVGDVVTICTALGHELTATPNHPVATGGGWVPIAELAVGGHVLSSTRPEWVIAGSSPDVDDVPPCIEDVAQSFAVQFGPVPTAAEDFHGDGAGSEVHVVRADRLLVDHRQSRIAEHVCEHELGGRNGAADAAFLAGCQPAPELERLRLGADSVMGGARKPGALLGAGPGHPGIHALAAIPGLNAGLEEHPADGIPADAEGFCECLLALSSDVALDEIVSIRRHPFSGHVYNLDTVEGWYIGNGIITHNCRCSVDLTADARYTSLLSALLDQFTN